MALTGAAQIVFMAGWPVSQVQLPVLLNARLQQAGRDLAVVPLETSPEGLEALVSTVRMTGNCLGLVLTAPHKQAAARLATTLTPRARALAAANVLRRTPAGLEGDMFDGEGFWNGLGSQGFAPAGRRLALVGAGAAARAIALEFLQRGGRSIVFRAADSEREAMSVLGAEPWSAKHALEEIDCLVNATPAGMPHAPGMAVELELLRGLPPRAWVADLVTRPLITPLLEAASTLGLQTMGGAATARGQLEPVARFLGLELDGEAP